MTQANYGGMGNTVSWEQTLLDTRECFRRWGVEDFILPTKAESQRNKSVRVDFAKRGTWVAPTCGRFDTPEQNFRAVYLALDAFRKADQRGIGAMYAEVARALSLPDPTDPYRTVSEHAGVEIDTTTAIELVRSAYRRALQNTHPDHGGKRDDYDRVREAGRRLGFA